MVTGRVRKYKKGAVITGVICIAVFSMAAMAESTAFRKLAILVGSAMFLGSVHQVAMWRVLRAMQTSQSLQKGETASDNSVA